MDSRVGQTITNVLYAMQYFSDRERGNMDKGEGSGGDDYQRKDGKISVRTNGDVKSLKNGLEARADIERNSMKRTDKHNGLPEGILSYFSGVFWAIVF